MQVRTILCPVDFSTLCDRELQIAVELAETFGARLVLHHNLDRPPMVYAKTWEWEWQGDHPPEDAEKLAEAKMNALLAKLPDTIESEATISRGLVVPVLLQLVGELPADLVVLGSHGWSTEEHASVGERIIERCPCPVLTLREKESDVTEPFKLREQDHPRILVPTDFSESADEAVQYAFELTRIIPAHLDLYHVVSTSKLTSGALPLDYVDEIRRPKGAIETARHKLEQMVPGDLVDRVEVTVETGSVVETMARFAEKTDPRLIVMGRHASGFVRQFFTQNISKELLHQASCPVLFAA